MNAGGFDVMRIIRTLLAAFTASAVLPLMGNAATLGGTNYAIQYEYRDFYIAADNKPFRVELLGNPFPGMSPEEFARRLLPVMQANKPPPRLTFTYDAPAEQQHPDYRLMLVFDAANDLGSDSVCKGAKRFKPGVSGQVNVFAVYCRNDQALSEVTGWTNTAAPDEAAMGELMKDLFNVVFDRSPYIQQQHGHHFR
jgi:hypothetical protein